MKQILIIVLLILSPCLSWAIDKKPGDLEDQNLINWMRSNRFLATGMPYSFEPLGIKRDVFLKMGAQFSTTGIIERMIVDQGVSIYDTALWQIVLSRTGDPQDLALALKPVEYYWNGDLDEFTDIRTGADNQIFVYDPDQPEAVTSDLLKKGYRGFIFRILNATGRYRSTDPLDQKESYEDYPNDPRIHWEDWKPIAGENAWVVMAAMHLLEGMPLEQQPASAEFNLAKELARAALYLQADNGGIRMAPLGTYYHLLGIISNSSDEKIIQRLDERSKKNRNGVNPSTGKLKHFGNLDYPPEQVWYYEEISTENNLSWYAALRMLYHVTNQPQYLNAMERIERYLKSVWDPKSKTFYQGVHFNKGSWVPNVSPFAADVQNWAIAVLGPQKIDEWFGEGSAYAIWTSTKDYAGVYDHYGLEGIGYTKEKDRLSIEWTAGAILAVRKLASYYALTHPDWSAEAKNDAISMRLGVDNYCFKVRPGEAAYSYSSVRRWIPFGWFSHGTDVLSLASTSWIVLIDNNIDPFNL